MDRVNLRECTADGDVFHFSLLFPEMLPLQEAAVTASDGLFPGINKGSTQRDG